MLQPRRHQQHPSLLRLGCRNCASAGVAVSMKTTAAPDSVVGGTMILCFGEQARDAATADWCPPDFAGRRLSGMARSTLAGAVHTAAARRRGLCRGRRLHPCLDRSARTPGVSRLQPFAPCLCVVRRTGLALHPAPGGRQRPAQTGAIRSRDRPADAPDACRRAHHEHQHGRLHLAKDGREPRNRRSDRVEDGRAPGARTRNLRIKSPQLCQLS